MDIIIPVDDWLNEHNEKEPDLSTEDALVEARKTFTTGELARMYLAARAAEIAPPDLLDPDKIALWRGAMLDISNIVTRRKRSVKMGDREVEVREFVAYQPNGEDHVDETEDVIVDVQSELAVRYAERYLRNTIPGHVYNRLAEIAVNQGDVRGVADALIERINEIVEELTIQ